MRRLSPPHHRHDGTSPLPLGMDWSAAPRRWEGRNTIWPHDPRTGWSYCVMIPSWIVQPELGASSDSLLNPIIFYRLLIGVQSPEGVSTSWEVLRRFSDFLKLFTSLKRTFSRKNIPPAPPKHSFLRINSSRLLLEERRHSLEDWMGKLLSDIDISRSVLVAAFLELEAAARSSFGDGNSHTSKSISLEDVAASSLPLDGLVSVGDWSNVTSKNQHAASNIENNNVYNTSEVGTSKQRKLHISETSTEELSLLHDSTSSTGASVNGYLVGDSLFDPPEEFVKDDFYQKKDIAISKADTYFGNSSLKETFMSREDIEFTQAHDYRKFSHIRKLSDESIGSDISSVRGSGFSIPGLFNSNGDGSVDLPGSVEILNSMELPHTTEIQSHNDVHVILPHDQRNKLNRILVTMQRRLATARTDMEDLIARLNQEIAVKEYLSTKVKDLEEELETTKQKNKENLQQAIVTERERVTQIQWDMDELRRKCFEMESKLKIEENEKVRAECEKTTTSEEKQSLLQELAMKQVQLETLHKRLEDSEMKSKADIKVLVREVKFLRSSQVELREALNHSLTEKMELERAIQKEKQKWENTRLARKKLLYECEVLRNRLRECSVNFLAEEEDKFTVEASSLSDALDLLATSDNRIGLLLAEAQLLARDDELTMDGSRKNRSSENSIATNGGEAERADDEVRKMLTDILIDNARLRKQVNSVIRCALKVLFEPEKEGNGDIPSRKTVLNRFLER